MDDSNIVSLFWKRSEEAIRETRIKYGRYCHSIAYNILRSSEDAEECVNDTYVKAWNVMPPDKPGRLGPFLGKITRNFSLDRYKMLRAQKRGMGEIPLVLDELQDCIPDGKVTADFAENAALTEILNQFLGSLSAESRRIFLRRYQRTRRRCIVGR